ncbi:MAG: hypothetical protein PHE78_08370 [Candidatus Gastranaerophilales bacterium]|nr:hypothetical protein [Candidatus Gastranaerophilales bacterium]
MTIDPIQSNLPLFDAEKLSLSDGNTNSSAVSNGNTPKQILPQTPLDSFEKISDTQEIQAQPSIAPVETADTEEVSVDSSLLEKYYDFLEQYPDMTDQLKAELKGYLDSGNTSDFYYFINHYYPSIVNP